MATIRKFDFRKDIKAILALESKAFGANAFPIWEFAILLSKGAETFLVAYQDEELAGYISAYIDDTVGYVASIAVGKNFRRQGVGSKLIQAVIDIIKESGSIETIELHVRQSNQAAIALYKSLGFTVIFTELNYYQDEDAFVMALDLAKSG